MTLDPNLIAAVKGFEGFTPVAVWDYRQWTNGYGTRAHAAQERIDVPEAERRLIVELEAAQAAVDSFGPAKPEGVRNALTSLTFNSGTAWMHDGLGDAIKAGNWKVAKIHFLLYDRAGGKIDDGLVKRRAEEASWFPQSTGTVA